MSNESFPPRADAGFRATILSPRPKDFLYDQCISVNGALDPTAGRGADATIRARIGDAVIGEARVACAASGRTVFQLLGRISDPIAAARDVVIELSVASKVGSAEQSIASIPIRLIPSTLPSRHYGEVVHPTNATVLHRENIYGSGPPAEQASPEAVHLVLDYLPEGSSIVDVGCGSGAFAHPVMGGGHRWLGLEVNEACLKMLERRHLPFRKIEQGAPFPAADAEWDHAICIEVLEHIAQPEEFLSEIARVTRSRALFSVPNIEVLPYFQAWGVVPWHLLEGDHKNFFTRASLRALLQRYFTQVEVFSYGKHPLRTRDGIPLHLHFFAVAQK